MILFVWNSIIKFNYRIIFVFLIVGGGGGCDGVVMMFVWLLRIIILLVKCYCNRIESINFMYINIVCVSGLVWIKKKIWVLILY